ncbi:MAG: bifunctional DNA-formamidopyrimidine glycosylase/DNA-(apurinic or apyrimidinic site) lyase [Bryobacterales bacterium]|nr:bifunctional DNA-formamidopyrimidine glycosylase/DNA-(apurinic or apyrimidinic site) lyase [Bryobacterales bacterium]
MPELPEVEAVCRKLGRTAQGGVIASSHIVRKRITAPQEPEEVEAQAVGRRIERIERRGKNIFLHLAGGLAIHVHLRMTGNLEVIHDARFRPHSTSAWFEFDDGRALLFADSRGLGTLRLIGELPEFGIEPLSRGFTNSAFARLAGESRAPVKLFLMDQSKIAGIGNIYAVEALWRAGISPFRPSHRLSAARLSKLRNGLVAVLREGVKSAVLAYAKPGGFNEAEQFPLNVYDREGESCFRCGAKIRRVAQGGRSTYYCGRCQR